MELKDQVKMIVDKSVTYFVAQDGNESGLVLTKQILYSLIELVEQTQKENEQLRHRDRVVSITNETLARYVREGKETISIKDTLIESQKAEITNLREIAIGFNQDYTEISVRESDYKDLIESLKEEIEKLNEVIRTLGLSLDNAISTHIKEPIRCEHGFNVNLFCAQCIDQEGESHE